MLHLILPPLRHPPAALQKNLVYIFKKNKTEICTGTHTYIKFGLLPLFFMIIFIASPWQL